MGDMGEMGRMGILQGFCVVVGKEDRRSRGVEAELLGLSGMLDEIREYLPFIPEMVSDGTKVPIA